MKISVVGALKGIQFLDPRKFRSFKFLSIPRMTRIIYSLSLIILISLPTQCFSQLLVNGVDIGTVEGVCYLKIVGFATNLSGSNRALAIEYGQKRKLTTKQEFSTPDGVEIEFENTLELLNYLVARGYEYVGTTYFIYNSNPVENILLRRKE